MAETFLRGLEGEIEKHNEQLTKLRGQVDNQTFAKALIEAHNSIIEFLDTGTKEIEDSVSENKLVFDPETCEVLPKFKESLDRVGAQVDAHYHDAESGLALSQDYESFLKVFEEYKTYVLYCVERAETAIKLFNMFSEQPENFEREGISLKEQTDKAISQIEAFKGLDSVNFGWYFEVDYDVREEICEFLSELQQISMFDETKEALNHLDMALFNKQSSIISSETVYLLSLLDEHIKELKDTVSDLKSKPLGTISKLGLPAITKIERKIQNLETEIKLLKEKYIAQKENPDFVEELMTSAKKIHHSISQLADQIEEAELNPSEP